MSALILDKLRVLVIDDSEPLRDLVCGILRSFGIRDICAASNGSEGLRVMRQREPDLVICDIAAQETDGLAFVRAARDAASGPDPRIPIIVLSGIADRRAVKEARDLGATEYLVKPITAESLWVRVRHALEQPRDAAPPPPPRPPARRHRSAAAGPIWYV